jgi:hypothetical protein
VYIAVRMPHCTTTFYLPGHELEEDQLCVSQVIHCLNTPQFPIGQSIMSSISSYKWGTSAVPTDINEEFAHASYSFRELGDMQRISLPGSPSVCIAPAVQSARRSAILRRCRLPESTQVYVLYCYPEEVRVSSVLPEETTLICSAKVSDDREVQSIDTALQAPFPDSQQNPSTRNVNDLFIQSSNLRQHIILNYPGPHGRLTSIRSGQYGSAYVHISTARYITEICSLLGIRLDRTWNGVTIEGISGIILPSTISTLYNVNYATLQTMRTNLTRARDARRLLSEQDRNHGSLPASDLRFLHILDHLLDDNILDERLTVTDNGSPERDAAVMKVAELGRKVNIAVARLGGNSN